MTSLKCVFHHCGIVNQPFGSDEKNTSVDEALRFFLKAEVLNGDNKYSCEKCNKKCDAVKGIKLDKLPYILALQLKRFDFDYE
jgi:ubiquitin carboxyl-terminal hydrolase 47